MKQLHVSEKQDGVEIKLLSLAEVGGKDYLRLTLHNYTDRNYEIEMFVMIKEKMKRKWLFRKVPDGFTPVTVSVNMRMVVPKKKYNYGIISYEQMALRKNERLVLKVYEKGNNQPLEVVNVPWEAR